MYQSFTTPITYYVNGRQVSKSTYYRVKKARRVRYYTNNQYGYKQRIIETLD